MLFIFNKFKRINCELACVFISSLLQCVCKAQRKAQRDGIRTPVSGNLDSIAPLRLTSPADCYPIQTTHVSATVCRNPNRKEMDGEARWGRLGANARLDTFSLFLFSLPVLIISILGCRGSPNIEPVLIDQLCINKPRPGWQLVSRGQIGCTDYLHYQGQASLGASGWVCYFITMQDLMSSSQCKPEENLSKSEQFVGSNLAAQLAHGGLRIINVLCVPSSVGWLKKIIFKMFKKPKLFV